METPYETPSVPMRSPPQGGLLRSGNPGNKGGGRPPDEFKALMRELASREDSIEILRKMLTGELGDSDQYLKAREHVVSHGYGRAQQTQVLEVSDDVAVLLRELRDARSRAALPQPETTDVQP